ncbi:hypothetical protein Ac2012v2_002225 [Leucoagaricus gongylophorus]
MAYVTLLISPVLRHSNISLSINGANFSIGDFYFSQESSISMLVSDVSEPCVIKNKSLWLASGPSIVDMRSIRDVIAKGYAEELRLTRPIFLALLPQHSESRESDNDPNSRLQLTRCILTRANIYKLVLHWSRASPTFRTNI